jgi:hypothetical protein
MDTIITTTLRESLGTLPADTVQRDLVLRRAAETCAAGEAAAALDLAARNETGPAADLLLTAASVQLNWPDVEAARVSLSRAIAAGEFTDPVERWIAELRALAATTPQSGACTVATALQLWSWTTRHFLRRDDRPESVIAELAESFSALAAARCQVLSTVRPIKPSSTPRTLLLDLSHMHAARTASRVAALCAELVHGYRRHPAWDAEGCASCYGANELDELEGLMPGFASAARAQTDVIEADGSHALKAGPCVTFRALEGFTRLRAKLDGCLTGARLAGDRAAAALGETVDVLGN